MEKKLSSKLTIVYKIFLPILWIMLIVGLTTFIFLDSNDPKTFLMLFMLIPILLLIKIQQITYDNERIYIQNWRSTKTFELKNIIAINEGSIISLDPFFEIEIKTVDGTIIKIEFMPKVSELLNFMLTNKYTGNLFDLKSKIIDIKNK
jgi:hypothetical protein